LRHTVLPQKEIVLLPKEGCHRNINDLRFG
jgi:hypothetical protein